MTTTITPSVYKIDIEKLRAADNDQEDATTVVTTQQLHAAIKTQHELRKERIESKAQSYQLAGQAQVGRYNVAIYKTTSNERSHPWTNLFDEEIPGLQIKYPNLAAFFALNDELYAISSGMGYTLFEQFIDTSFPLQVARHIMSPLLTATTERDIAGAIYGRDQQFRTSQLVISSQNLGTVWQTIKGDIIDDFKTRKDFSDIYIVGKSKITVTAGSSLKIHKAIDIRKLANLLDLFKKVLTETIAPEQKQAFEFLDGLTELSPRKEASKIEEIKQSMGEKLYEDIVNNQEIEFDFSHRNFTLYQSASEYNFPAKYRIDAWPHPPTASEVFAALKDNGLIDAENGDELIKELSEISFTASHEEPTNDSTHASIIDHLHGEIHHQSKNYFLIDGKVYGAKMSFIDRVHEDYKKLLKLTHFAPDTELSLDDCASILSTEGDYNESYLAKNNWLVGDRVFWENVEVADLIHWNDDKLYIIHNKVGFGVTVRDVCSQVLHSMNILDRMRNSADTEGLGKYYDKIIGKYYSHVQPPVSKEDFVNKVLKTSAANIIYVIGYIKNTPIDESIGSNIAKFEVVKLCSSDRRVFDFGLKVVHIPKIAAL